MTKEEKTTLIKYRLERANESLKAAQLMLENKLYIPAMNRIYYSMFYSVQALLVLSDEFFKVFVGHLFGKIWLQIPLEPLLIIPIDSSFLQEFGILEVHRRYSIRLEFAAPAQSVSVQSEAPLIWEWSFIDKNPRGCARVKSCHMVYGGSKLRNQRKSVFPL